MSAPPKCPYVNLLDEFRHHFGPISVECEGCARGQCGHSAPVGGPASAHGFNISLRQAGEENRRRLAAVRGTELYKRAMITLEHEPPRRIPPRAHPAKEANYEI